MHKPLDDLYRARRRALEAEAAFFDVENEAELVPILARAIEEAQELGGRDRTERSFRLQVLADLCPKVADTGALALLLQILNDPDDSVRARAAASLGHACHQRFPEVVRVAQDAIDAGLEGPALLELPGLLLDASGDDQPVPVDILVTLVEHEDPEVVAEAACALAELDMPGVRELLESLEEDERPLADADDGASTVGELVRELLGALELGAAMGGTTNRVGDA